MISLTQEKREELIAHNTEKLKGLKQWVKQTAFESVSEELELDIQSTEIALASLTANVFAHGISASDGKVYLDETCCIDYDGQWVSDEVTALNDGVTDLEGGYRVVPLFTAPPVPEIKIVDKKDRMNPAHCTAEIYLQGKSDGWNDCLAEIKRLNGLGD